MIVLEVLVSSAAMAVALFCFGYGATRLLLPPAFHSFRHLVTPLVGMALAVVWDYLALFAGLNLTQATWALLGATTALALYVVVRRGHRAPNLPAPPGCPPLGGREQLAVLGIALVALAAALAPLARYGYLTIIGENWDYEFYLPLADLLRELPTGALAQAPANPLLETILSRHILPLPMGFAYLQATLDVLTGRQALDSFAVLLGVLRALAVVAAFVFTRQTLRMSPRAALLAAALTACNGLLLWFTYWNFGLHLASLALLPLALTFGAHALMEPARSRRAAARSLALASLFLAALNVTYHPALVAALLTLGALGVHQLVTRSDRRAVAAQGVSLLAWTVSLSFPTLGQVEAFLREYYDRAPLAIGLREFVPLSDGYGLSLRLLELAVGHTIPTAWLYEWVAHVWDWSAVALTAGAIWLTLYGLWQLRNDGERRAVWYLVVGVSAGYVALFRLPFLRPYAYGFLKSLSLVSYILIAAAVQGGVFLWTQLEGERARRTRAALALAAARGALLGGAGLAVAVVVLTFGLAVEQYFKPLPPLFDADALSIRAAAARLPRGATIFLTDRAQVQSVPMGLAAYALREHELRGNVRTGYGALENAPPGAVFDYALLARGEDPQARGYHAQALWENQTFALYARQPGLLAQRKLDAVILPATRLTRVLNVDERLARKGTVSVRLALASFQRQTAHLAVGDAEEWLVLEPGLTIHDMTDVPANAPIEVSITPEGPHPHVEPDQAGAGDARAQEQVDADQASALYVPWMQLHAGGGDHFGAELQATVLLQCVRGRAKTLTVECQVANPDRVELEWRWVIQGKRAGENQEEVIAQGALSASPQARLGFSTGRLNGEGKIAVDDRAPFRFAMQPLRDGAYRSTLEVYHDEVLVGQVELASFSVTRGGRRIRWTQSAAPHLWLMQP